MAEYVNPKYTQLVEQLRAAQQDQSQPQPVRGFLVPEDTDSE
ncbi:hypothetical protein [Streptacidiphilus cavernicola]|uniref:Uncharacterized protein n=1 Tax=Streptacidiphilus cavernicola TaxID=3342716 RepID=A0ABV6VRG4_9ACTN